MIIEGQSIAYTNVVSKEYYFHYEDMEEAIEHFVKGEIYSKVNL